MSKGFVKIAIGAALIGASFIPGVQLAVGLAIASIGGTVTGGIAIAGTLLAAATAIGAGEVLTGASQAFGLGPKAPSISLTALDRLNASMNPGTPRIMAFGRTALATDIRYVEPSGTNQEYVDYIIAVASHKVHSILELWLEDTLAWSSTGGVQGIYVGFLEVSTILEGGAAAYHTVNGGAKWGAAQRLTGCASAHLRIKRSGTNSPFTGGLASRMTIIGEGIALYDSRLDSTVPGGSGSHRADDQTTWTFDSATAGNIALQSATYLLGWRINGKLAIGRGIPKERLDLAGLITSANLCDEMVTTSTGSQPRYHGAGLVSEADDPAQVLGAFATTCNGRFRETLGKLGLIVMHNDLALAETDPGLGDDEMIGQFTWNPDPSLEQTYNVVRGRFTDPSAASLYQLVDYPEIRLTSLDGIDRVLSLDLPWVQDLAMSQRIAKQVLERKQYQRQLSAVWNMAGWCYKIGDIVPVTLSALGADFVRRPMRVEQQIQGFDGTCPMILTEENEAIYAWDADDRAGVTPADPIRYDPLNNPILIAIDAGLGFNAWTPVCVGWTPNGGGKFTYDNTGGFASSVRSVESFAGAEISAVLTQAAPYDVFVGLCDPVAKLAWGGYLFTGPGDIINNHITIDPVSDITAVSTGVPGAVGQTIALRWVEAELHLFLDSVDQGPVLDPPSFDTPLAVYIATATNGTSISNVAFSKAGSVGDGAVGSWTPVLDGWVRKAQRVTKVAPNGWDNSVFSLERAGNGYVSGELVDPSDTIFIGLNDPAADRTYALYCFSGTLYFLTASGVGTSGISTITSVSTGITATSGQVLGVGWVGDSLHIFIDGAMGGAFASFPSPDTPMRLAISSVNTPGDGIAFDNVTFARSGPGGAPGYSTAIVTLYQRAASTPSLPSNDTTYTFATHALSPAPNNGWSTTIPAVTGNPLWVTQASAFSNTATDAIAHTEWSGATTLTADGLAGLNSATVFLYQRATSAPSVPAGSLTYTFLTGALSGTLGSWSQTIPSGTNPIYVIQATATATTPTDSIATGEWSTPNVLAQNGADGFSTAQVLLYKRSTSGAPSGPTTTGTYTFATASISFTGGGANGWTLAIPAGTDPLYVTAATAFANTATDTIATTDWAGAVLWAQNLTTATATLYKRGTSTPAVPASSLTYTFSTGALSGTLNGWSQTWPSGTDPVYVTTATALSTTATDTITTGEWAAPIVIAQNGTNGTPGAGAFTIVDQVNTTVVGNVVTKTGGVNGAYDAAAHSVESFANGCTAGFTGPASGQEAIVGISQNPTASASYDLDYGIVKRTGGTWEIFEAGLSTGVTGSGANGAQFQVTYTNGAVVYQKGSTVIRNTPVAAGKTFYLDMSLEVTGTVVAGLSWAKAGADGIGGGASSNIYSGSGSTTGSALTSVTLILPAGAKVTWESDLSFAFVSNPSSVWTIQHQVSVNGGGYSAFGSAGSATVTASITTADSDLVNSYTNTTGSSQEITLRAVCTHPGGGSSTWSGKGYAY